MNKPTVTVTPDDGCSINKMCVRESGTVASNVTAHRTLNPALYHSIERIAELEAERDELQTRCEAWEIYTTTKVHEIEAERDALAAHVLELRSFVDDSPYMTDRHRDGERMRLQSEAPQTSLTQRDARAKAEALDELVTHPRGDKDVTTVRKIAREMRDKYRQLAEENNQ